MVLEQPWLTHNYLKIDWSNNSVLGWGPVCLVSFLSSALCPPLVTSVLEEFANLSAVLHNYIDLEMVFSKSHAFSLPPFRKEPLFLS